jgi:hypothetical protein
MIELDAQTEMLRFECDYCHALAGQWCETPSGARTTYLHSARYYRWRAVAPHG